MPTYRIYDVTLTSSRWEGTRPEDEPKDRLITITDDDQEELDDTIEDADGDEESGLYEYLRERVMDEDPPEGTIEDFEFEVLP